MTSIQHAIIRITLVICTLYVLFLVTRPVFQHGNAPESAERHSSPEPPAQSIAEPMLTLEIFDVHADNGMLEFHVLAQKNDPVTHSPLALKVDRFPFVQLNQNVESQSSTDLTQTKYAGTYNTQQINLLRLAVNLCSVEGCPAGSAVKTRIKVVTLNAEFDDHRVQISPDPLESSRLAHVTLNRNGRPIAPSTLLRIHLSAQGCVSFRPLTPPNLPLTTAIDLKIDGTQGRWQSDDFETSVDMLAPSTCEIGVAEYDDERQRPAAAAATVSVKGSFVGAGISTLAGVGFAFLLLLVMSWERDQLHWDKLLARQSLFQLVKWMIAVAATYVLSSKNIFGISIDRSSANGFFTTGLLFGFVPITDLINRLQQATGYKANSSG